MKHLLLLTIFFAGSSMFAQRIEIKPNLQTGAIDELTVCGDTTAMNWILKADGSQYPWVTDDYGWGLGRFQLKIKNEELKEYVWEKPVKISSDGMEVTYREGGIRIDVKRQPEQNDLVETYTFTNEGQDAASLSDIGIYTPFNDNYPDAPTCINTRTNAHIWEGGSAAYVNALRMGGYAPHLGLVVTEGAMKSYEIWERGREKANSHFRGVITLNPPDIFLKTGETYSLAWRLFSHSGNEDFRNKLLEYGSVVASANKYVFEKGETARVEFRCRTNANVIIKKNGVPVPSKHEGELWFVETPMEQEGEVRFDFYYGESKQTHVNCLVISNADNLIQKRVDFIVQHQQMNNPADPRNGAYMVYDNEDDSIYLNDTPNANPVDRDEGAERVGMGVLLAKQYLLTHDPALKTSLLRYAKFLREKLQTNDYITYSSVDQKGRVRGYNFVWVAEFYFLMSKVTGDRQYATHGYETLQALYRRFGYGFYAIEIPVQLGLQTLMDAGMTKEYDDLKSGFIKTGDIFVENGLNYPKHEVNYEQSIVAPAITFLTQLYLETGIKKYLDEATRQIPVLEAFNGFQPSFHLNDIAIRHWDGHWFGKREMFGDVFPHYWSAQTGVAFYYYALCTGDVTYQRRAENIVRNNLCLFFEDGKASCAYMYPYKINGIKAQFYDPYSNDQDWAPVSYLLVNKPANTVIYNGIPWFDNNGNIVNAHGACIVEDGGRYYLFGEWKSDTSNAFPGFSCYSSDDLVNWKFERVVLSVQPDGILGTNRVGERVKVMKCPSTGEYVMYMHADDMKYTDPHIGYATCNTIAGEYEFQGALMFEGKPIKRWDMGTFQDTDGAGYLLIHHGIIYRLSKDYRSAEAKVLDKLPGSGESPAMFKKNGLYYLLYSDLTSWEKNDNFYFTAPSVEGTWTKQGLFAPEGSLTFNSQTTFVFPLVRGNDTIPMFMGDRWSFPHQASAATYVWLPMQINGTKLTIPEYWNCWDITTLKPVKPLQGGETIPDRNFQYSNKSDWEKEKGYLSSNVKGSRLSVPFKGSQVAITGETNRHGGYARVSILNSKGNKVCSSLVDFYSKETDRGIRFISPKLAEAGYTLVVEVTGISPVWTDKSKTQFGSEDCVVNIEKIVVL